MSPEFTFSWGHVQYLVTGSGEVVGDVNTIVPKFSDANKWTFSQKIGLGAIVMHKVSLENLHRINKCIERLVIKRSRWTQKYPAMLQSVKDKLKRVPSTHKQFEFEKFLMPQPATGPLDCPDIKYHIAFGIIANQSYLENLKEYEVFYKD